MLAGPRGFEPRFTDPKSGVLPLDEGPAVGAERRSRRRSASGAATGRAPREDGAEDGTRTRDPHLGKVMLYQLSHFRSVSPASPDRWCREPNSNWRHRDFQSRALPTELSRPAPARRACIQPHLASARQRQPLIVPLGATLPSVPRQPTRLEASPSVSEDEAGRRRGPTGRERGPSVVEAEALPHRPADPTDARRTSAPRPRRAAGAGRRTGRRGRQAQLGSSAGVGRASRGQTHVG